MTYSIAMIPYANMAPFKELGPPRGCSLVDCLPRDSIRALKEKRVWAAAVPVGGLSFLRDETVFIGRFGIAVKGQSMSVLFFSDRPFGAFSHSLTIGLTGESASSVRLLYLLLGYQNGFGKIPYMVPKGEISNGYLVIGDRALHWAKTFEKNGTANGYTHVLDLAAQWYDQFQLPFVFARWVVHVDAPETVKSALKDWLQRFAEKEDILINQAAPKVAARLELPIEYAQQYLGVIRRCLSHEDEVGQAHFLSELNHHTTSTLFPEKKGARRGVIKQD